MAKEVHDFDFYILSIGNAAESGDAISTEFVESTVNQVASKCLVMKQQIPRGMRCSTCR